jgi:hypothetical protein
MTSPSAKSLHARGAELVVLEELPLVAARLAPRRGARVEDGPRLTKLVPPTKWVSSGMVSSIKVAESTLAGGGSTTMDTHTSSPKVTPLRSVLQKPV